MEYKPQGNSMKNKKKIVKFKIPLEVLDYDKRLYDGCDVEINEEDQ